MLTRRVGCALMVGFAVAYDNTGRLLGTSTIEGTGSYSPDFAEITGTMQITTRRGQPGPTGLMYQLRRIQPTMR